ncbi:nucleotidyltransferase domain-containing protein [Stetteria hydrogenophila]
MRPQTFTGDWNPHGAIVYTRDGGILQAIGLPAPAGYLAVIPKYAPCRGERTPWARPSGRYCRVVREYGPRGLEDALARYPGPGGVRLLYDGSYAAPMPYVSLEQAAWIVDPREALLRVASSGEGSAAEAAYTVLRGSGVGLGGAGLTGSYAAGIASPTVSDVDFVVYGPEAALRMYEFYSRELQPVEAPRASFGGVTVHPPQGVGWRRAAVDGISSSWVGVPHRPAGHCEPLRRYPNTDPPSGRRVRVEVRVEGGDPAALLYPPCVEAEGYYIVSFEYNLAGLLFEGGRLEVEGVASAGGTVVYLGLRENPGRVVVRAGQARP